MRSKLAKRVFSIIRDTFKELFTHGVLMNHIFQHPTDQNPSLRCHGLEGLEIRRCQHCEKIELWDCFREDRLNKIHLPNMKCSAVINWVKENVPEVQRSSAPAKRRAENPQNFCVEKGFLNGLQCPQVLMTASWECGCSGVPLFEQPHEA